MQTTACERYRKKVLYEKNSCEKKDAVYGG